MIIKEANSFEYKFKIKPIFNVFFFILIIINSCIMLSYMPVFIFLRPQFITQNFPDFYLHVSNLGISLIFYLSIGLLWLLLGINFNKIIVLEILFIVANILCETIMGFMNTPDLIDMVYGIIGTFITYVVLLNTYKKGLFKISN